MPTKHVYDSENNIFKTEMWGVIHDSDIINQAQEICWDPNITICKREQVDLSGLTGVKLTENSFFILAEFYKKNAHKFSGFKKAIISEKDLPFGMSRMYETISEIATSPVKVRTFRSYDEALVWLMEPIDSM